MKLLFAINENPNDKSIFNPLGIGTKFKILLEGTATLNLHGQLGQLHWLANTGPQCHERYYCLCLSTEYYDNLMSENDPLYKKDFSERDNIVRTLHLPGPRLKSVSIPQTEYSLVGYIQECNDGKLNLVLNTDFKDKAIITKFVKIHDYYVGDLTQPRTRLVERSCGHSLFTTHPVPSLKETLMKHLIETDMYAAYRGYKLPSDLKNGIRDRIMKPPVEDKDVKASVERIKLRNAP